MRVRVRIEIVIDGTTARVGGPGRRACRRVLDVPGLAFSAGPAGVTAGRVARPLGWTEAGDVVFPAKLAWAAAVRLRASGHEVAVTTPTWPLLPRPTPRPGTSGPAADLLADPVAALGGLVRFAGRAHPFAVVPDLIRAYPAAAVVVGVPNRDAIRGWVNALRAANVGRPVRTFRDLCADGWGRPLVHVATLQQLDHCRPDDFDVVVVPDIRPRLGADPLAGCCPGSRPQRDYRLLRHWHVPAFGFLPAGFPLSPAEEFGLQALFAGLLAVGGDAPARVRVVPVVPPQPTDALPDPAIDPAGYRRAAVWQNTARNAFIGRVSTAVAVGSEFQTLPAVDVTHPGAAGRTVVVLVENSDHAARLSREMPGWAVRTSGDGPIGRLTTVVATEVWANRQRPLAADVLIDARGWGAVELPGFPARMTGGGSREKRRGVELIDIADAAPAAAADRTRRRRAEYERREWEVVEPASQIAAR